MRIRIPVHLKNTPVWLLLSTVWLGLVGHLSTLQAQPSSFTSAQIEVGIDCNWPYSAIATNPTDGKMYALWRKGADVSVTYKLIRWDGSSWTQLSTFTTATGTSSSNKVPDFNAATDRVSLAIDGTGRFHVTFSGISASANRQGIWYGLSTNGTSWSFQALQILAANSTNESLAEEVIEVDAQNQPHVAFRHTIAITPRTYTLRYYRFTGGNWVGETAFTQSGSSNGGTVSNEIGRFDLAIDGNAKAHFSFRRETAGSGRDGSLYYTNNTTGNWSTPQELMTGATDQPQAVTNTIDTDAANKIHIVHSDYQKKLYYTTNVSGTFVTNQLNGNLTGEVESQHALRINTNGDKFVVFNDGASSPTQLNYAYQLAGTTGNWTTGTGFTPTAASPSRGVRFYSGILNNDRRIMLLFDNSPTSTSGQCGTFTRNFWYATATVTAPLPTTAPVVATPANGSLLNTTTPVYTGTAPAGSTVTVYIDNTSIGTTATNGSGNWSKAQLNALAQGSHTVYATAQLSGRAVSANSNTNTFSVDTVRPTVTITSTAGASGGTTGTSPIPFTVSFSKPVTGFVAGDITVTNGTPSGFSGSGTTYSFNVTPSGAGTVTLNVPANVAQDAAANGNTAASPFTITYAQPVTAAPVVIAPANGSLLSNRTPSYAGTAPASSTVTVSVDGTPIGTTTATGGSWNLTQPVNLAEGSHTVSATARLSGQLVSPTGNTNTFTIDATPPTATLTGPAATSVAQIALTATFSEPVTGFSLGDVSVTNGTLNSLSGSGTTFTLTLTATASGPLTVSVLANTVQDLAGNGNLATSPFTIQYTPNNAPTAMALSGTTVAENQPAGTVVGTLSSTDADLPAQTFTYALVNGSGDADNGAFSLQGNTLRTAVSFDFETKASYTIRVRTTDSGTPAQSYETNFTIAVSNSNELTVSPASQTNVSCNGGSTGTVTVTVSGEPGPYTYDWSPGTPTGEGTPTIEGLVAGTYSVRVTAANGFTATTNAQISQPAPVVVTISPASTAVCGGPVQLTANTAATSPSFVWTGTTPTTGASVEVTSTGVYSVTLTDSQGCQATATTSVTVNTVPSPTLVSSGELSCTNPIVTLTAGGGTRYAFSGGASPIGGSTGNTATVTSPGLYSVTVSSAEGCTSIASVSVSQDISQPSVRLNPTSGVLTCTNPRLTLQATSPVSDLQWSTGATSTSISVSVAGTYSVTATGTNGCQATASASITSDQALPVVQITPSSATLTCANPSATLTVTGGGAVVWSTGSTQPQITVSTAGVYSVSVTAANGCQGTTQASIMADFTLAAPQLTASSLSTSGEPISVTATGCAGTLNWLSQSGTGSSVGAIYTVTQPGNYTLSATCTVGTCTSPAAPALTLQIRPGGFAITGVSPVSCQLLDAGRGQYEVRFTPQYAGVSGPVSFAVVNELASTTAPAPYTLRLYNDNPLITLVATQSGSPEARFVYNWLAACSVGTPPNRPPVARLIPDQTLPQNQAFSLALTDYITDPDGQPLIFSASGLPADLSLSGSRISGTAATTGLSTISVTALDPAGLQVTTSFQLTVTPLISTPAGFTIVGVTTVSCQTLSVGQREIRFLPQYGGLNGQPITFQVANELAPTTQAGPYTLRLYTDNPGITLQATQAGTATPATFRYDWLAGCGAVTTPPTPDNRAPVVSSGVSNQTATVGQGYTLFIPGGTFTDPDGDALIVSATGLPAGLTFSGSTLRGTPATTGVSTVSLTARDGAGLSASLTFTLTVVPAATTPPGGDFGITSVTTVNCAVISAGQRRISFTPQYGGVSGSPISFSVVNELSPTTAPGPYSLLLYTDNPVITLQAQQGASLASYRYDWLAACSASGRQGAPEWSSQLRVTVLGNPVLNQQVVVEVRGAEGQPLQLTLTNLQGQVVSERVVGQAGSVETQSLPVSAQPAGLLLLRVSTPTQRQTINVLNR